MKIAQRPYKFSFSKNPLQYKFSVPEFATDGCFIFIRIYRRDIGGANEVLLYEEQLKPASDIIYYDIQSIVESALEYNFPDFSGSLIQAANNVKEFYISFAVITTASPVAVYTSDVTNLFIGIKGGIPQPQWDWNNYFINYVLTNKPFLTWQTNNRFIGQNDSFFLSWFNSVATVPVTLRVDAEYTDGTTAQVFTDFTDNTKKLYHLQAGPDQLGLNALQPTKKLYKYSLSIVATTDHTVYYANPVTYYIDYRKFYNTKFLHYYNSLGGIECIRVNGNIETIADVAFTEAERFGGNIIIGHPNSEEYTQTAKQKVDSFKGNTGYFFSPNEQDVLQEILLSRFAWERILGNNWRIYITNKSTSLRKSNDKLWFMGLEWRYSFTNTVYAPLLDLGAGQDTFDYCVKVGIAGSPSLPDAVTGTPYSYSLTLTGDAPIAIGSTTKPSWMTISISGNTVSFTGTPDAEGTAISVSVSFTNCTDGSVTFSDTIDVVCVGIEGTPHLPQGRIGEAYNYTFNLTGTLPFTVTTISAPSWMTISISGNTVSFTGTPDATGTAIPVSITIDSCTSLDWDDTVDVLDTCQEYYNNSGQPQDVTYTPCGAGDPVSVTVQPGDSICGKDFSGAGFGYLILLGNC